MNIDPTLFRVAADQLQADRASPWILSVDVVMVVAIVALLTLDLIVAVRFWRRGRRPPEIAIRERR